MREDHKGIADRDLGESDVADSPILLTMCERGHASRKCLQCEGGSAYRISLECLPAGEHEYDKRSGQVFTEDHGRDDGNTREQIGAEFQT